MKTDVKMQLICNEVLVNEHSGSEGYGWTNPLDMIPPIGSIIEYMTFNQNQKEGAGVLTKYVVTSYTFTTEEDYNFSYRNKVCKVHVDKIED